jgi:hypothetical protein
VVTVKECYSKTLKFEGFVLYTPIIILVTNADHTKPALNLLQTDKILKI